MLRVQHKGKEMNRAQIEYNTLSNVLEELTKAGWELHYVDTLTGESIRVRTAREAIELALAIDVSKIYLRKKVKLSTQHCTLLIARNQGLDIISDYSATDASIEEVTRSVKKALDMSYSSLAS